MDGGREFVLFLLYLSLLALGYGFQNLFYYYPPPTQTHGGLLLVCHALPVLVPIFFIIPCCPSNRYLRGIKDWTGIEDDQHDCEELGTLPSLEPTLPCSGLLLYIYRPGRLNTRSKSSYAHSQNTISEACGSLYYRKETTSVP